MISIITPSFNQGAFIERTIQSVLTQGIPASELEYVVMDGGSEDETVSVLKQYETQLKWVSEKDRGQAHAVNKGWLCTQGDIIGWLNSDDIYLPGSLKKVVDFFNQHPNVDVLYGEAYFIDKNDKILSYYPTEKWHLERFKSRCYISQPATFFRRRVIEQFGLLDEDLHFCMDYEYWLRLGLKGATFAHLPTVLACTRVYAETKTSSGFFKANREALTMLKKHLTTLPAEWLVSQCGAQVRAKHGVEFPHPFFILGVWGNLWQTVGEYQSGNARLTLWLKAQYAMISKVLRRIFFIIHHRLIKPME